MRRLGRDPHEGDLNAVEKSRQQLSTLLIHLKDLQAKANVSDLMASAAPPAEDETQFDDDDVDGPAQETELPGRNAILPIERQLLHLPSAGNVTGNFQQLELGLRKNQAERHLNRIRELIADKSFQYSHVLRDAPTAGMTTKARSAIKNLNLEITRCCRIYNHCRTRLYLLCADEQSIRRFRPLKKDDIKASTAVLDPNTVGSTKVQLSWIWQSLNSNYFYANADADAEVTSGGDPTTMMECESLNSCLLLLTHSK